MALYKLAQMFIGNKPSKNEIILVGNTHKTYTREQIEPLLNAGTMLGLTLVKVRVE